MNKTDKIINKRKLIGIVVSDKMDKTRVVEVSTQKKHSRYEKFFKVSKRFKAHDESNLYHLGDKVIMGESRPISRDKRWIILEKIGKVEIKADNAVDENILETSVSGEVKELTEDNQEK